MFGPRARTFTLRLMSLVACKITVVGGRRLTGPYAEYQYAEYQYAEYQYAEYKLLNINC